MQPSDEKVNEHGGGGTATHYDVLRVEPTASYGEIKAAFHGLARRSHPDKRAQNRNRPGGEESSSEPFLRIQRAWETLRDPIRRAEYDGGLRQNALSEVSKRRGAIALSREDLEAAVDEETGETVQIYDCRCGEIVEVVEEGARGKSMLVECPGCCFVYKIVACGEEPEIAAG